MSRPSSSSALALGVAAALGVAGVVFFAVRHFSTPKQKGEDDGSSSSSAATLQAPSSRRLVILYGTTTGTAKNFSHILSKRIAQSITNIAVSKIVNLEDYDEDMLCKEDIVLLICSTFSDGKCPESCALFFDWLQDYAYDFRVSKDHLSKVTFAAFGLGGQIYGENYCKAVREHYIGILQLCIRVPS